MRASFALLIALSLVVSACSDTTVGTEASTSSAAATTTTTGPAAPTTIATIQPEPDTYLPLRTVPPFASGFEENPLLVSGPDYAGPPTPASLDGVLWGDQVAGMLPSEYFPGALDRLATNGFVVVPGYSTQFHEAYGWIAYSGRQPVFVTTDAAYHYWHLVFAKALRDTEREELLPALEGFALRFADLADAQATDLAGDAALAEAAAAVAHFAELIVALLELDDGTRSPAVTAELGLISDHLAIASSPTTGAMTDYTLFVPRGHYAANPDLTRYFLAMSALGGTPFGIGDDAQLTMAMLIARLFEADARLRDGWQTIYEPTSFLVGLADDYTPLELAGVAGDLDPAVIADPAALQRTRDALSALRPVAIDPASASVRVMGARFVLDSYVLDQLVHPNVPGRMTASPLDVAAAFGSDWALARIEEAGEVDETTYLPQLDTLRTAIAARPTGAWAGTVYDAWLYALAPSWSAHGAVYPDFMRTDAWAAKAHQSAFGSYTELKHDTVLYAKQAFAEGETPAVPAEPRHWVEPEPVVFARLAAAAGLMRDGLTDRDLLTDDVDALLGDLIAMYERFERLALDELAGLPITPEDNEWLETIGTRFELLWVLTADADNVGVGGFPESPDDMAAVIVDIMSNPTEALEIATGLIDTIYVLVPNDDGVFQVARGGVYSYYEFWVPRGERMTDQEWRRLLNDYERAGDIPDRPAWTDSFFIGRAD